MDLIISHFIIKKLAEEFWKQFTCLGENTEKCITFTVPIEKEVTRIDKNREEITKKYILHITYHNQILPVIFLKELIELNVNSDMTIKNVNYVELNTSTATVFLDMKLWRWFNRIQMFML